MSTTPGSRPETNLKTMPSENTADETDMMSRLSGYFEALRSRKDLFIAQEEMEIKRAELKYCSSRQEETYNPVLPKVLPFPVETCTLDDLIKFHALQKMRPLDSYDSMGPNDNADLILWIMKDFLFRLWGLHYSGATHGNLKPQNVLIVEGECVIESTLDYDSESLEWKSREQILNNNTATKASDMFTFGCILYFCITKGCHPFGETPEQRIWNIKAIKADISRVKDYPDAYHLISLLLNPEPELRPKAHDVYAHPFFTDTSEKLSILDSLLPSYSYREDLEDELITRIPMYADENWRERLYSFCTTYSFSHEQPFEDFKDVFGPRGTPTFFPTIFMEIMDVAVKFEALDIHCSKERISESYYLRVKENGFRRSFFFDGTLYGTSKLWW